MAGTRCGIASGSALCAVQNGQPRGGLGRPVFLHRPVDLDRRRMRGAGAVPLRDHRQKRHRRAAARLSITSARRRRVPSLPEWVQNWIDADTHALGPRVDPTARLKHVTCQPAPNQCLIATITRGGTYGDYTQETHLGMDGFDWAPQPFTRLG